MLSLFFSKLLRCSLLNLTAMQDDEVVLESVDRSAGPRESTTLVEVILRRLNFCKLHPARIRIATTTTTSSFSSVVSIFVSIDHHLRVAAVRIRPMLVMFLPSRRIVKVGTSVVVGATAVDIVVIRTVVELMMVVVVVVDVVVVVKVIVIHLPERIRLS